ncbi:MAG: hypothetical protein J6Q30_05610 [Oscillospiraceae bacterium]|nr:hypothetical protein [Oscillospiraceae bacterium]
MQSASRMLAEGCYPNISDGSASSQLDNFTDALMLMESKATTIHDPGTILTNPLYTNGANPVSDLYQYSMDSSIEPSSFYVRYWMGFRSFLRLALVFLNYYQIKRYLALAFFGLFAAVLCSLAKNTGARSAFFFALSVILVKPQVICASMQFSCCFLIAFAAMLLVPWLSRNIRYSGLFFMEVGMITMFLDFYTTPIITFGLPAVYLYLLQAKQGRVQKVKEIFGNLIAWFAGYLLMWLSKLVLTTLLTDQNAIQNGLGSLLMWLGADGFALSNAAYRPDVALKQVLKALCQDRDGMLFFGGLLVVALGLVVINFVRRKLCLRALIRNWPVLLIACMPIIWFVISAEPTTVHYWFQYRSVVLCFWALFGLALLSSKNGEKQKALCS